MRKRVPSAPEHLSDRCRKWWRSVVTEFILEEHHLHLLRLAAEALDRSEEARAILAAEGIVVRTGETVKAHPAVAIERDARIAAARLIRELALDAPASEGLRPPRTADYGVRR
jgi:P27 family predicted phage terminase small subunit